MSPLNLIDITYIYLFINMIDVLILIMLKAKKKGSSITLYTKTNQRNIKNSDTGKEIKHCINKDVKKNS